MPGSCDIFKAHIAGLRHGGCSTFGNSFSECAHWGLATQFQLALPGTRIAALWVQSRELHALPLRRLHQLLMVRSREEVVVALHFESKEQARIALERHMPQAPKARAQQPVADLAAFPRLEPQA